MKTEPFDYQLRMPTVLFWLTVLDGPHVSHLDERRNVFQVFSTV